MCQGKELGGSSLTIFVDKKSGKPLRDEEIMKNIISEVEKMDLTFGCRQMLINSWG